MTKSEGGNSNREIYNTNYVPAQLEFLPKTPYDVYILDLRLELLNQYCTGQDVLDLCCGSGSYMLKLLGRVRSITGLDFSRRLLVALSSRLKSLPDARKVAIVEGDAIELPFADASFGVVFSYTSLYYVPNAQKSILEVSRVLQPGGIAILELGNFYSLATLTSKLSHIYCGWAKPYHMKYRDMHNAIERSGLIIEQHHALQIMPMFGPKVVQLLLPFSLSLFKYPLGIKVCGRTLDSWISGLPILRKLAFRHVFVLRKP